MSEMKRVELTTVSSSQKQKKVKWKQCTYRFTVTLGESNAETCPEYSFADLVKDDRPLNGAPFDEPDEDREVAAIAQRFEAKYGPKGLISGKRKRTQEMDDYYDPGEGYDEDDPFIDNTEAHDEVVPAIMTTQHGGFYINQGKLDFKYLDEDSSDAFISTQEVKKTKKKRVLDSDSEEETGAALAKKFKAMKAMKRKKQLESKDGEKQRKKQPGLEDRENIFKRKKLKNLDKFKLHKSAPASTPEKEAVTPSAPNVSTSSVNPASPFAMTTPTIKSSVPSLANHTADEVQGMSDLGQEVAEAVPQEALKEDSSSKSGDEGKGDNQSVEKNTLLPAQLPVELLDLIDNIKREAKESKEKKLRFFSEGVNKILLDIELGSRNLPWGSRTAIYSHLGEHLPCGKHTLQRRAKKLRESQQEGQLKLPMRKLKEVVMKMMPELEQQHELDVQRAKNESEVNDDVTDVKEEASTESDEEGKTDNKKKPRGPRRKFQWTAEIRDLLSDIVSAKMKLFSTYKSRNQTAEEYLKTFLDAEIKPIWPQGWMQTRMLFKESKKAHEELTKGTLQLAKPKKAAATNEVPPLPVENTPMHMSKTEDVIEISSTVESDDEKNNSVVNSSGPKVPIFAQDTPVLVSMPSHSTPITPSISHVTKQSFKAPMALTPVTHLSPSSAPALTQKTVDSSPGTSLKRVVPIPVLGSKIFAAKSLAPAFSTAVESSSGTPGSVTQQSYSSQPASPQQKLTAAQQTANSQQHKHPQELLKVVNQQQNKAAMRSSPVHNSSWAHVNSVVPATKPVNPFVAVNRIPETAAPKLSLGGKSSSSLLQQNHTGMPLVQQQEKTLNNASVGLKPNQTVRKLQQSETSASSGASSSDILQTKRPVSSSQNSMSSRPDSQTKTVVNHPDGPQKNNHPSSPHSKSGIVGSTSSIPTQKSSANSGQKFNQQNQQIQPALGVVLGSPQPNSRGNANIPSRVLQSQPGGGIRQHSPPAKLLGASNKPAASLSPPLVLLDISSSPSMSRSNTPSPQKSPVTPPGSAALSLYEQIKSQIWHQEAMEDQALKNLALALNCGGADTSRMYGNGADAGSHSGKR